MTILIIDDNVDILEVQKTVLELDGYDVLTALGGSEAIQILEAGARPHLILLDVNMDGPSGPEVLTELEKRFPDLVNTIPIVFLTAMDKAPEKKASGFMKKATDIDTFLRAVKQYLPK